MRPRATDPLWIWMSPRWSAEVYASNELVNGDQDTKLAEMSSVPLLEPAGMACGFATELVVKTAEFLVIWNSAFWLQEGKNRSGRGVMDPGPHSRVGCLKD